MNRKLLLFFLSAIALFAFIYWGLDTKSSEQKAEESKRQNQFSSTTLITIEKAAKEQLDEEQMNLLESLEFAERSAKTDSGRIEALKNLSGAWYQLREPALAGHYAEKVAEMDSSDIAWSIAGSTYAAGLQFYMEDKKVSYCVDNAIDAFERAISINPDEVDHRTNLAVMYADYPPKDNPMKGILMLRQLQETYPGDKGVLIQLARFGIQTGQYEKAEQRLQQVLAIDSAEMRAICMLAEVYKQLNRSADAEKYRARCK